MTKSTLSKTLASALATTLFATSAFAATQGTPGATSTGSADISITIPKLIRARSFSDFTHASYAGTGDVDFDDTLNISKNYSGTYQVTASGSGTAGAFTITDGTQTIAYTADYNDAANTTGEQALTSGTPLTAQAAAATTLGDATLNANLGLNFPEANLQAVSAGTYLGTITLVFEPE